MPSLGEPDNVAVYPRDTPAHTHLQGEPRLRLERYQPRGLFLLSSCLHGTTSLAAPCKPRQAPTAPPFLVLGDPQPLPTWYSGTPTPASRSQRKVISVALGVCLLLL